MAPPRFYGGRQCDECYRLSCTYNNFRACTECHDGCNGHYCQRHLARHVCDPGFVVVWTRHCEGKVSAGTISEYYIKHNIPTLQRRHHAT